MYLSSRQKEFVSNSGNTSVAFIIRAATTALHICNVYVKQLSNNTMLYAINNTKSQKGKENINLQKDQDVRKMYKFMI